MAKAKILLKRKKSVTNTKKITRTMEMVSTAKYKQTFGRIEGAAPFLEKLREMMADVAGAGAEVSHPLLESRPVKRSLVLLLTSNRGLCGGYNTNLNLMTRDLLVKERESGAEVDLEVVGKKGIQYFRHRGEAMVATHDHFGVKFGFAEVDELAERYLERYATGEIDRFTVVHQKFLSAARQMPVTEVLLPLDALTKPEGEAGEGTPAGAANYLFEPDPEELLRELLPQYFKTTLFSYFLQAEVGEHRARMVAMKNATDAADDLIKALTRMYNRARQSQITNEIAELMGGVEALK